MSEITNNKIKEYRKYLNKKTEATTCQDLYGISASDFLNEISQWDKNDTVEERVNRFDEFCKKYNITSFIDFLSDAWWELGKEKK